MTTVDVLRAARGLIEDQSKWTTGTLKCNRTGRMCALGAVARIVFGDSPVVDYASVAHATPAVGLLALAAGAGNDDDPNAEAWTVVDFNDEDESAEHHAKVLDLFDRAITLAGE